MYTLTIDAARDWRNAVAYEKEESKAEGKKEAQLTIVKSLIENTDHSDEEIANLVSVPLEFVQEVRKELRTQ